MPTLAELNQQGVQYDPQRGLYYVANPQTGARIWISPAAFGGGPPEDMQRSFLHEAPTWNQNQGEWDQGLNWGNILSLATGGALGVGALDAALAGGAAASGAPAAGGALPATTTVPATGALAPAVTPSVAAGSGAGATAAATAAGAATTGAGMWNWTDLLPSIIGGGTQLAGGAIAASSNKDAAQAQLQATREALALQERLYNQQRGDLGPYRQMGYGALGSLSTLLGTKPQDNPYQPERPLAPQGNAVPYAATLQDLTGPGWSTPQQIGPQSWSQQWLGPGPSPAAAREGLTVTLRAPDGSTKAVPADQVEHYLRKGAVRV